MNINIDRNKVEMVNQTMNQIEKQFGKGAIMWLGSDEARVHAQVIPTGTISLDAALGVGGVPRGRVTEIYGPESSGKTTIVLHIIAEAQKRGGLAAFIDAEHALDPVYARNLGVDIESLMISQPDTGEQALEITEMLVRSGAVDVIAIDSVAALVPRAEIEGEMGDSHMGLHARLMSQALRKLAGVISKSKTCVIFTNQIRLKIGLMFGNPETTTGGQALKFYASIRMEIRRSSAIKKGDQTTGNRTKLKVVKNKLAPPFRNTEFDILYGEGVSKTGDLVDTGANLEVITKRGTWYSFGEERIGQGRSNTIQYLKDNPKTASDIESLVREKLNLLQEIESTDGNAKETSKSDN